MAKYVRLDTLAYRESAGTPAARTIYYNYPSSGDGAVIARLVHIAAVKNAARKPTREEGIKYCVPRIRGPERVEGGFSKGGDGAVIARLVHIAAAKNPAPKPT